MINRKPSTDKQTCDQSFQNHVSMCSFQTYCTQRDSQSKRKLFCALYCERVMPDSRHLISPRLFQPHTGVPPQGPGLNAHFQITDSKILKEPSPPKLIPSQNSKRRAAHVRNAKVRSHYLASRGPFQPHMGLI